MKTFNHLLLITTESLLMAAVSSCDNDDNKPVKGVTAEPTGLTFAGLDAPIKRPSYMPPERPPTGCTE